VQRIFNVDKIQDTSVTPDKVSLLNILRYGLPFRVITQINYKLLKKVRFFFTHPVVQTVSLWPSN